MGRGGIDCAASKWSVGMAEYNGKVFQALTDLHACGL